MLFSALPCLCYGDTVQLRNVSAYRRRIPEEKTILVLGNINFSSVCRATYLLCEL